MKFSVINKRHYLLYASPEHGFGLCPWRGVAGFRKCWSVPDVDIHYIHTVLTIDGTFIVGTTEWEIVSYKAVFEGMCFTSALFIFQPQKLFFCLIFITKSKTKSISPA